MQWASNEVVGVITYLLPGFVAAWVFYGLTTHPKPTPFERVVQALIFTAIIQAITAVVHFLLLQASKLVSVGVWTEATSLVLSVLFAFVIGSVFAYWANNDTIHAWLRERDWCFRQPPSDGPDQVSTWTRRTSYPSEWFGAFNKSKRYIVLHLSGGRRLYGWPERWPDQPDSGHFVMAEAEWLDEDNNRTPLKNVWNMLIPVSDVEMVEFMMFEPEKPADSDLPVQGDSNG